MKFLFDAIRFSVFGLRNYPISKSPIDECPYHLVGVEVVWKSKLDLARFIQKIELFFGKRQCQTSDIVLQLVDFSRTNNRDDWDRAESKPS